MVAGALSDLGGIAGGLIWKIASGIAIIAVAVGLFYLVRFIQKNSKKQKSFTINAIIVDLNGCVDFDMLAFVKSEDSGLLEMIFKDRKTDSVPPVPKHMIKNGYVMLLNYAPGHYCVIDTSKSVQNLDLGNGTIIPFNLGMKKYITSKQREIMNKQESKKKKFEQYAPWITLGITIGAAVILAAVLFIVGAKLEAKNIAARILECGG